MVATEYPITITISAMATAMTDARTPLPHKDSHKSGEPDAIKISDLAVADNVTTLDATTSHPGLLPTLSGVATEFLNGIGEFSTPAGGTTGSTITLPGSSTVYYNGLGAWTTPSASGSVFKPWITVGRTGSGADYICDGVADNVQIQAAIEAAASGTEIKILQGNYYISSQISKGDRNLTIRGVGQVNFYVDTGYSFGMYFYGSSAASITTLSSSASAGAQSIVVSSAANMTAGQNIIIYNDDDWTPDYSGLKTGEMHEIKTVSGTTITLNDPLMRAYSTSDTASCKTFAPVTIRVENINFIGPSATGDQIGLGFRHGNKINVQNCTFKNCGLGSIYMYSCYDANISHNTVNNSEKSGYGYGVAVSTACAKIRIADNNLNSCRHCVSCTSDLSQPGMNRDIIITGNTCYSPLTPEGVIDAHPSTINMIVSDNIIYSYNGRAFDNGAQITTFENNQVYGGLGVRIRDDINYAATHIIRGNYVPNGCLYYDVSATDIDELIIDNNICLGGDSQIYVYYKDTARSISITRNTLKNSTLIPIRIPLENLTSACVLDISNNTIVDCAQTAIYVDMVAAQNCDVSINNNKIRNPNTANDSYPGIRVFRCKGGTINSNTIYDTHGYNGCGIITDTDCDYFACSGNMLRGMTGTKIVLTGSYNAPATLTDSNVYY